MALRTLAYGPLHESLSLRTRRYARSSTAENTRAATYLRHTQHRPGELTRMCHWKSSLLETSLHGIVFLALLESLPVQETLFEHSKMN